jgi:hypothetical protein
MTDTWLKETQSKIASVAQRDPKKTLALAVLSVLLLGLGWKQFGGRPGTTAKAAVTSDQSTPVLSGTTVSQGPAASEQPVARWLTEPIKTLDRNLFQFQAEFYPRASDASTGSARLLENDSFWDELAKSMSAQADFRKQKQIRVDNLQAAASQLRVQSTIMGTVPRAMVDGRMVKLGGTIDADAGGSGITFKVVRIEARRIVIERDGILIELPMGSGAVRVINPDGH